MQDVRRLRRYHVCVGKSARRFSETRWRPTRSPRAACRGVQQESSETRLASSAGFQVRGDLCMKVLCPAMSWNLCFAAVVFVCRFGKSTGKITLQGALVKTFFDTVEECLQIFVVSLTQLRRVRSVVFGTQLFLHHLFSLAL